MIKTPDWLFTYEEELNNGQVARIEYDREGDTLEIFFADGAGRGLELTDEIVLRYDRECGRPLSLIFLTFSKLMQPTAYGSESFYLRGLARLSDADRQQVMQILTSPPVNQYLHVSALAQPRRPNHLTPIVYIRQQLAAVA
ncbi:MAG: DUF2283 domain-containing protein [Caldilineaceae bacterium]